MNVKSPYFIISTFFAIAAAAFFLNIHSLEAISQRAILAGLPPELRLARDVGILEPGNLSGKSLAKPVTRKEFGLLLRKTLFLLGIPAGNSLQKLEESGIYDSKPATKVLTRKHALEAICRLVIHLEDIKTITIPTLPADEFKDYVPPPKYAKAVSYLKKENIIRGYGKNYFGSDRNLTKREAIYLVYRLYEKISLAIGNGSGKGDIFFVDLPKDHPVMDSIRRLHRAGAFDLVQLSPSFDGNRFITMESLSKLCQGILDKAKIQCLLEFDAPENEKSEPANRYQLARIIEKMVGLGKPYKRVRPVQVTYSDIPADHPDAVVLSNLAKVGIVLGYPGNKFVGDEYVTWFEVVGTLDALIHAVWFSDDQVPPRLQEANRLLVKEDIENLVNILRAKKERIHNILKSKPRAKGNN